MRAGVQVGKPSRHVPKWFLWLAGPLIGMPRSTVRCGSFTVFIWFFFPDLVPGLQVLALQGVHLGQGGPQVGFNVRCAAVSFCKSLTMCLLMCPPRFCWSYATHTSAV